MMRLELKAWTTKLRLLGWRRCASLGDDMSLDDEIANEAYMIVTL